MKRFFAVITVVLFINLSAVWIDLDSDAELFSASQITQNSTEISFNLNGYKIDEIVEDNISFQKIIYSNEGELLEEGKPSLPQFTRLIAIPDEGTVTFDFDIRSEIYLNDIVPYPAQPLQSESNREILDFVMDNSFYSYGETYPIQTVQIGEPAIMRDIRLVSVTINPFQYDPQNQVMRIVKSVDINVTTSGFGGVNPKRLHHKISRSFLPLYKSSVLNFSDFITDEIYQRPSYLFIVPNDNNILNTLQTLVDWKKQKGFEVTVANTSVAGTTFYQIKSYIQNAYNTWENPPEFICLVGDAEVAYLNIPTDYMDGGPGDHGYVRLDGTDVLADAYIGRLSISSNTDLQTIISKILNYEKIPFMQNIDWYQKAFLLGDPGTSGQSVLDTKRAVAHMIETTHPHYNITENYSGNWVSSIANNFNNGISYFNYRGFGTVSGFQTYHIDQFTNGKMLPFCVLLTCNTGDFTGSYDSYNERFLKAGTTTNPKGGIGAISTATGQTHTTFNNCMDAGIYYGIFIDGLYHMGGALNRGKLNLFQNYPSNPSNCVFRFSYWNNLMGDPGLALWTNIPEDMIADFNSSVPLGAQHMPIHVTDTEGNPLQDVWITALMDNDLIFATGYTDENGNLNLEFDANVVGTVNLTMTKHNFKPVLETFSIGQSTRFVRIENHQIDDDNLGASIGNGDGNINPGETIELTLGLKNYGTSAANNVNATLSSNSNLINVISNQSSYGSIASNAIVQNTNPFVFELSPSAMGNLSFELLVSISDNSGNLWEDYLILSVSGANLYPSSYQVMNDPNGILDPGETADIKVTLDNIGATGANNISGTLICSNSFITVIDESGFFGTVNAGGSATNATDLFTITADSRIVNGTSIPFELHLSNPDGYNSVVPIIITVGTLSVTDPVGPCEYGYYIYDDSDVGYLDCPVYDWIEISGTGTQLPMYDSGDMGDLETINLPITFRFYGDIYDQLTVCSNGFLVPGTTQIASYMNWLLPGPMGPSPIIAVFWDDLKFMTGSAVYWYFDPAAHYVVVQWHQMRNDYNNAIETFQVILYDANYYPTSTGDSQIKFQYHTINNVNQGSYGGFYVQYGGYATIGIEDPTTTRGLTYTFDNIYHAAAKPLQNEMAILITGAPIQLEEPYLVYGGMILNDNNGNGLAEYGEDIDLMLMVNNLGEQMATGVTAELTTNDPYILLTNSLLLFPNIPGNGSALNSTPFELEISENCPDNYNAAFILNLTTDQGDWELLFNITLYSPSIEFHSIFIDDGNNGILDPGETADVYVSFQNHGGAAAYNLSTVIDENDPYIEFSNTTHNFTVINGNSIASAMFIVTASPTAPVGHIANINWNISGDLGYQADGIFQIIISQVPVLMEEDFSGAFPPAGWTITGGSNWQQGTSNNAGGVSPEAEFYWSPSTVAVQRLISPQMNTLGSQSLDLSFKHYLSHFSGSYWIRVQTTSDGSTWNDAWNINVSNSIPQQVVNVNVTTPDVGSATFQIAWVFDGDSWDTNNWNVDDIMMEGGQGTQLGFIDGSVTLIGGSGNVEDTVINAGAYSTSPAANGQYLIPLPAGTYNMTASLSGYNTAFQNNVVVVAGSATTVNFPLSYYDVPQNLLAEVFTNDVHLSWQMPTDDESNYQLPNPAKKLESIRFNNRLNSRNLSGFRVYRNSLMIGEITNPGLMEFDDLSLAAGLYEYYVTAVYDDILESGASASQIVEVILLPPTELQAQAIEHDILLSWTEPAYARNLTAYRVYRNSVLLNQTTQTSYLDVDLLNGSYSYFVTALYGIYESEASNEVEIELTDAEEIILPSTTAFLGNHPNPFNPQTTIRFSVSENTGIINITIFNLKGQKIKTILNEELSAGYHNVIWNGTDDFNKAVASGIYLLKFETAGYKRINKMIMLR